MRTVILFIFLVCAFFASCEKEIVLPDLEGSMVGFVYTFDEFANKLEDRSGVYIAAFGLDGFATKTDYRGRFEFRHLPAGTYELRIYKPGFGTLKQFGIKHLGGMPTTLSLSYSGSVNSSAFGIYQIPETEITDLSVESNTLSAKFRFKVYPQPVKMNLRVYLSDEPGFSINEAKQVLSCYLNGEFGEFRGTLNYNRELFGPGKEVYCRACILNRVSSVRDFYNRLIVPIDYYVDYKTNITIYPNLGDESKQISFIVPE